MDQFRIRLAKETFKFSATHFTILCASEAERLHGHNYQIAVECLLSGLDEHGMGFEFNLLKPFIKNLANAWDERVLMPRLAPQLSVREESISKTPHWVLDFIFGATSRSYRFPQNEVVFLETKNITSEELARLFTIALSQAWKLSMEKHATDPALIERILTLSVTIEETKGQSATYILHSPLTSELTKSVPRSDLA